MLGNTFKWCKYPISHHNFAHVILASIDDFCLQNVTVLFVKRWFSILIFPSTFVHWNSTIKKSCTFSPTYLFIQLFTYQHELILFDGLEFIIIIIYFVAEIVQVLITRSSFKLASTLFWHHAINFLLLPYFLGLQNIPGSSCTFPGPDLQSTTSPGALLTFLGKIVFRNQNLGSTCVDCYSVITHLQLFLGPLSR